MEPIARNSITERVVFTGIWVAEEAQERKQDEAREPRDGHEPAVREPVAAAR